MPEQEQCWGLVAILDQPENNGTIDCLISILFKLLLVLALSIAIIVAVSFVVYTCWSRARAFAGDV